MNDKNSSEVLRSTKEVEIEEEEDGDDEMEEECVEQKTVCRNLSPQKLESLMRLQIERNNDWIEKMSPIVKYKIQEYIRKQKNKKMQRRKFSLACGLRHLSHKPDVSKNGPPRRRAKRIISDGMIVPRTAKVVVLRGTVTEETPKSVASSSRRKSAPVRNMDMGDLDDLE